MDFAPKGKLINCGMSATLPLLWQGLAHTRIWWKMYEEMRQLGRLLTEKTFHNQT